MTSGIRYAQNMGPPADVHVNLRLGYPSPENIPVSEIKNAAKLKFEEVDPSFFTYTIERGYEPFRQSVADFVKRRTGKSTNAEDIMACLGASGGIDLIAHVLSNPGDVVLTEDPTYFLAYGIFRDAHLKIVQIHMESDGVNLTELEKMCKIHKPKLFYTIPVGHNPTGRTTSHEKKKKIAELSQKYDFLIVSDEPYQFLSFPEVEVPPPYAHYDIPENPKILSVGSFSKVLAPGLRLGWIHANEKLLAPLWKSGLLDSGGCVNPMACGIVHKMIELGDLDKCVDFNKALLRDRCNKLKECIKKYMPEEASYEEPDGGYFLIMKLPYDLDSQELATLAHDEFKVTVLPGTQFGKAFNSYVRLSFSYYSQEDIETGVRRLSDAINKLKAIKDMK